MARVFAPLNNLYNRNKIELLGRWELFSADAVIFHRHWREDSRELMKECQRRGIACLLDHDDDVLNLPPYHPSYKEYSDQKLRSCILEIMKQADAVLCSTENLKQKLLRSNPNSVVVPNGVDLRLWRPEAKRSSVGGNSRTVIGWAGSKSHHGDFDFLMDSLYFSRLYERYGESILFRFLGYAPPGLENQLPPDAYEIRPWTSVIEYPASLERMDLDLAIMPLADNDFNRAKSNLKWLEMSMLGIPCLASRVGPYKDAEGRPGMKSGWNCWTVKNRPTDWFKKTCELVDCLQGDPEPLRTMAEAAKAEVAANYNLDLVTEALVEQIRLAVERRSGSGLAVGRVSLPAEAVCRPVTVVVPVFNAAEDVMACVKSVLDEIEDDPAAQLQIVDDASTDAELRLWLDGQVMEGKVGVYRFLKNVGFVQACNMGARLAGQNDILLLNSDARLAPGCLARLRETAYSSKSTGTVTAVTNNGELATVPDVLDIVDRLNECDVEPFEVPTAVGHCMYIKREVIDKYGLFDTAFGRGYGEENDFSLRIREEYRNVVDPKAFCWHRGSASFGDNVTSQERRQNARLVDQRYPSYGFEVHCQHHTSPIKKVRQHVLASTREPKPKVLHVAHSYFAAGGTEKHVNDLATGLADEFMNFVVFPNRNGSLYTVYGKTVWDGNIYLPVSWPISPSTTLRYEESWGSVLNELRPDVIHVHHLLNHPLGTLDLLVQTGIPVIVTLHDYYFLCPDFHLPGCPGVTRCDSCFVEHFNNAGPLEYQHQRRALLYQSLRGASKILAPSRSVIDRYHEVYPSLQIELSPLGVEPRNDSCCVDPNGKLKFVVLGHFVETKGSFVLLPVMNKLLNKHKDVEFHIHGHFPLANQDELPDGVVYHGQYSSSADLDFSGYHAGIIASQVPESFCLTLSELQSSGMPVLVSNVGALPERVKHGRTGWIVDDYKSQQEWEKQLESLIEDRSWIGNLVSDQAEVTTRRQMLDRHREEYRLLLSKRDRKEQSASPFKILG